MKSNPFQLQPTAVVSLKCANCREVFVRVHFSFKNTLFHGYIVINGITPDAIWSKAFVNPLVSDAVCVETRVGQGTITQVNSQRLKTVQLDGIRIFWQMDEWILEVLFGKLNYNIHRILQPQHASPIKKKLTHGHWVELSEIELNALFELSW